MLEMESPMLDRLDLQLLAALEINGRASFSRLGTVLGVSDQTVARRFRRLSAEAGLRVVAVRDGFRLGQDQWMMRFRCAPDSAPAISDALARRPDTGWIGLASGGTYATLAVGSAPTPSRVASISCAARRSFSDTECTAPPLAWTTRTTSSRSS